MGRIVYAVLTAAAFSGLLAQAQEPEPAVPESKAEIERLRKIIMEEQEIIAECMKRIDKLEAGKATMEKGGLANVKFTGDFRYRFEHIEQDPENVSSGTRVFKAPDDASSRTRHRLRLRAGAEWTINEEWTLGARVATTMNADPVSTNQTMGNGFSKKDLWIDLAYFDYHPLKVPGLKVTGGKINNPFYAPGKTQMVWDQDLTPEGLALQYTNKTSLAPWEFGAAMAFFQVDERSLDSDAQMFGIQGTAKYNLREDGMAGIMAGLSYYDYINAEGYPPFFANNDNFGNSLMLTMLNGLPNNGYYSEDFNLVELFTEINFPIREIPFSVFADAVLNTGAEGGYFDSGKEDTGWAAGFSVGKCVAPKSWSFRYEYRDIDRDAVVGAFTDSDFGGGGTNASGHILGAEYMLAKNVRLAATYFLNHTDGSDWIRLIPGWGARENVNGRYQRLQLDLNLKF